MPSGRAWRKIVKNPDNRYGKGYQVWACITQFDAAAGTETFRADATYKKLTYWYTADNARHHDRGGTPAAAHGELIRREVTPRAGT